MRAYWLQFAKTGNPNSSDLPKWPAFSTSNGKVMNFANEPTLESPPDPVLCDVFRTSIGQEED
jgi:para-nitrobenzyl esterase